MRRRAVRLALPALAAAAVAAFALPAAEGQDAAIKVCPGGQSEAVLRTGDFTEIRRPDALAQISTFAAGGGDGQLLLASDGKRVMRSIDGGCSWRAVSFATPDAGPADAVAPKITQLVFPEAGDRAYMLLSGVGDAAAPQLQMSTDGGETWGESGSGLPAAGRFRELVAAPDDPNMLYLIAGTAEGLRPADAVAPTGGLYVSEDGGDSWEQRDTGVAIDSLAVDPIDAKDVWIVRADHSVELSTDAGAEFTAVTPPDDEDPDTPDHLWREVAVAHQLPANPLVALFATNGRDGSVTRGLLSANLGANWIPMQTDGLGPAGGAIFGRSPGQLFWAAGSESTAFHGPGFHTFDFQNTFFVDTDELDLRSLEDPANVLVSGGGSGRYRAVFMRRDAPGEDPPLDDLIVRYDPPEPESGTNIAEAGPCKNDAIPDATEVVRKPVGFEPGRLDLQLQPGQPVRADLRAALPAVPTPLDVYFLIDHSTSMDPAIEGLFCSVTRMARELPRRGIDVAMGLGGYSDYFLKTYQRYVDIAPPGPRLSEALRGLFTYGGVHEPIRSALYQTATGEGLNATAEDPNGQGPGGAGGGKRVQRRVDPGQQANFRDGSLKIALVIGDEPYEDSTGGEPPREDVVRALVRKGILAVGVQVLTPLDESVREVVDTNDPLDPEGKDHSPQRQLRLREQLEYFARESGALAPRGGVDCDGGGAPDVAAGDPLVCSILENGIQRQLDETLITLLRGIEDRRDVRIVPAADSPLQLGVESGEFADLDVTRAHALTAVGVVGCSEDQAGKRYPLAFDVMVGDRRVGRLEGSAMCGTKDEPAPVAPVKPRSKPAAPVRPDPAPPAPQPQSPPPAAAAPPTAQAAVAPAPPPPPPAPAPAGSVQLQPMGAQAPSSAVAPAPGQGAGAAQEQQKLSPKLAVVRSDGAEGSAPLAGAELGMTELQMTARGRELVPPAALATLGVGGAAIFGAFGIAVVRRRRLRDEAAPARASR